MNHFTTPVTQIRVQLSCEWKLKYDSSNRCIITRHHSNDTKLRTDNRQIQMSQHAFRLSATCLWHLNYTPWLLVIWKSQRYVQGTWINHMPYILLIDRMCKVNGESDGGSTILWYSCKGNEAGVNRMLARGADANVWPLRRDQSTALLEAVDHGHSMKAFFRMVLPQKANEVAAGGCSDISITQILLDHGQKVDASLSDKCAPLLEAIRQIRSPSNLVVEAWRKYTSTKGPAWKRPCARRDGQDRIPVIISMLIGFGKFVESQDDSDRTLLDITIHHSSTGAVQVLFQKHANPNTKDRSGLSAIFHAVSPTRARSPITKIINMVLMHGADVDCRGPSSHSPQEQNICFQRSQQSLEGAEKR